MFLKFTKNDLFIVFKLSLLKFTVGFIGSMVIPIFPSLVRVYFQNSTESVNSNFSSIVNGTGYSYHKLSILFVTKNLCQILCSPIVGGLVDMFGALVLLLAGTIFQLLTLLVYGFGNVYYLLILGRLFEAASTTIINCAAAAYVAFKFRDHKQRGFVYGIKALSYCVGSAVGPAYGGIMYQYYGKTVAFLSFLSLIGVEIFFVILVHFMDIVVHTETKEELKIDASKTDGKENENLVINESLIMLVETLPKSTDEKSHDSGETRERKELTNSSIHNFRFFKDPYFLISVGTFPVIFISVYLLYSSLSQYMVVRFKASESQQGIIWITNLLGYILGFISGNIINTKFSTKRHLILMIYTIAHGLSVISIALMPNWWSVAIPLCIIVHVHLVAEVVLSPILATIAETRHDSRFGVMSGIVMMSMAITGSLGSFLGPILLSTIGFMYMNIGVFTINIVYAPLYLFLGKFCQSN